MEQGGHDFAPASLALRIGLFYPADTKRILVATECLRVVILVILFGRIPAGDLEENYTQDG